MSDTDIVNALRNSDTEALREVYDRYHRQLYRYILYRIGNSAKAEDLLQDVYVRLWKYRKNITRENFPSYLYSIASSLLNNKVRRRNIELEYIQRKRESLSDETDLDILGMSDEINKQKLKLLEECINTLPEKQRATLLMNRSEGLTYEEIATYLELSQKAIEKRISKAYDLLRMCMEKLFG